MFESGLRHVINPNHLRGFRNHAGIKLRRSRSLPQTLRTLGAAVLLALTVSGAQNWLTLGVQQVAQSAAQVAAASQGGRDTHLPNTLARFRAPTDQRTQQPVVVPAVAGPRIATGKRPDQVPPSAGKPVMHSITIPLDSRLLAPNMATGTATGATPTPAGPPGRFTSSEGLVTIELSPHSLLLSSQGRYAPVGPFTLHLVQTQGGFHAEAVQIARFTLQVLDGHGRSVPGVRLVAPLTLRFHYAPHELDGLNPASLRLDWPATGDPQHHVPALWVPLTIDRAAHSLVATLSPSTLGAASDSTGATGNAGPVALPAGPLILGATTSDTNAASSEHFSMDGNQGDLTFTVPLAVPPAAGGLTPPLQLVYSSAGPNSRHSRQAPAPWVGDGWDLSLGSISYDLTTQFYYLNGIGGASEVLLCCDTDPYGHTYFVPHHHPQIRVFTSDNDQTPTTTPSAYFIVRTPDGLEYHLGTTGAARKTTIIAGGSTDILEWDVTSVSRTATNTAHGYLQQYTVTYWQDTATDPTYGHSYVRDEGMQEIDYNYDASGTPRARILFNIHWPGSTQTTGSGAKATQYGSNYNCTQPAQGSTLYATTLRCDDPVTQSGWEAAPLTMSTLTLDAITMQVWNSDSQWHTVRQDQLSYLPDTGLYECWDDLNANPYPCSGEHLLASIQSIPYQSGTAMPSQQPLTFGYTTQLKNEYHDTTQASQTWNGTPYDAQTYWQYLNQYVDKQTGASATAAWATGYGNTHGVTSGSVTNPTTCDNANNCINGNAWPEDRQWPRQIVTSITDTGVTPNTTTSFAYTLNQACGSGCTQDTWIPPNGWNTCGDGPGIGPGGSSCLENGWLNFYNEEYTGFQQVVTTHADGSTTVDQYEAGNGWGTNDWDLANTYRGMVAQTDVYQGNASGTPLAETDHTYLFNNCPLIAPAPNDQLYRNPYLFCLQLETQRDTYLGGSSATTPAVPHLTQTWTYYKGGNGGNPPYVNHFYLPLTAAAATANDLLADSFTPSGSSYGSTQPTFTTNYTYTYHDGTLDSSQTGTYLVNLPAQVTLDDSAAPSSLRWACAQTSYDGQGYSTAQNNANIVDGLVTRTDGFADCGTSSNSYATCTGSGYAGPCDVTSGAGYDGFGQSLVTSDADALAGVTGHTGCAASVTPLVVYPTGASSYTTCATYDSTQHLYPTAAANAKNQQSATAWDMLQGVPTSSTDPNSVVTNYAGPVYEYNGSISLSNYQDTYAQTTLPGETYTDGGTSPWTGRVFSYSFCAGATSGTAPCLETDAVRQLDGNNPADLAVRRQFYDRDGRLVETRTLGPTAGYDAVTYTSYDAIHDKVFQSVPCQVPTLTTSTGGGTRTSTPGYVAPAQTSTGSGAFVDPATTSVTSCQQANLTGTTSYSDALGRPIAGDDPMGTGAGPNGSGCLLPGASTHHTSCATYTPVVASSTAGLPTSDTQPYFRTLTIDPNLHQQAGYTDALGRTAYAQRYSGASQSPLGSGIASYAVSSYLYDPTGRLRQVKDAAGNLATFTYDALGRLTSSTDPDLGTWTYTYDANGNVTKQADGRQSAAGTVYAAYDGLDRQLWLGPNSSGSTPYACYAYDGTGSCPMGSGGVGCTSGSGTYYVGRLCAETFSSGPNQGVTGSYTYAYDQRGRPTSTSFTLTGPATPQTTYTLSATYDDADRPATVTYPAIGTAPAETLAFTYNNAAGGVASALSSSITSPTALLFGSPTYTTQGLLSGWQGGASPQQAGMSLGYDGDLRLTDRRLTSTPSGGSAATVAEVQPTYDAAGNVATLTTTLGAVTTPPPTPTPTATATPTPTATATPTPTPTATATPTPTPTPCSGNGCPTPTPTPTPPICKPLPCNAPPNGSSSSLGPLTGSGGTETQAFCYDEQSRLTWAGTQGSGPCGRTGSEGIAGAGYTASYTYDSQGRIASGSVVDASNAPLANTAQGSYTYDPTRVHAVTSVGSGATGYAASYDAAGDQTCRAVGGVGTCPAGGGGTGQQLGYDGLRRLLGWQNAATSSTATEAYAYDGSGQRVWQQATQTTGSTTTTTTITYVLGVEEVTTTALTGQNPTTSTTSYYPLPGGASASRDASGLTYQASDVLGTPIAALNLASGVVGEQLRAPYGQARYAASATTNGGMHTTFGFTGQREDTQAPGSSGLDYFNARYYDPVVGRFTSADDVHPSLGDPIGLDGFAYVGGQVESATDPSGHMEGDWEEELNGAGPVGDEAGGGSGGSSGGDGTFTFQEVEANGETVTVTEYTSTGVTVATNADGTLDPTFQEADDPTPPQGDLRTFEDQQREQQQQDQQQQQDKQQQQQAQQQQQDQQQSQKPEQPTETPKSTVGNTEPIAPSEVNDGEGITYRGTRSIPDDKFVDGFTPQGDNEDLLSHAEGGPGGYGSSDSAYVATSLSPEIAVEFARGPGGYVYSVIVPDPVDVNAELGVESPFPREVEIAARGGIPARYILGARLVLPDGTLGPFIPNPNYDPGSVP